MLDFFLFPDNEHHPKKEPSAEEIEERERQSLLSEYDYLFLAVKDRIRLAGEENDPCSDYIIYDDLFTVAHFSGYDHPLIL